MSLWQGFVGQSFGAVLLAGMLYGRKEASEVQGLELRISHVAEGGCWACELVGLVQHKLPTAPGVG